MEKQITRSKRKNAKDDISTKKTKIDKERLKVSILRPLKLCIGRWEFEPTNDGDELRAKAYFVRKQLTWEVLRNGCRRSIAIDWSNIVGIRATLNQNEPGVLDVELSQPPKFYKEIDNVDPRAHEKWIDGSDFTNDKASRYRRHLVLFPPGMLNKHFEKLINFDERLCELSRKSYPTSPMLYFEMTNSRVPTQHIPPSNQTLQLDYGGPTPAVGTPSRSILFPPSLGSAATNFSPQQRSGVGHHIECSNVPAMDMGDPQVSNMVLYSHLGNMSSDFNRVSNDYSNWPMYSYGISNDFFPNGPVDPNRVASDHLFNEPSYSQRVASNHFFNEPSYSQNVSNGHLENNRSTYLSRVSNDYFSYWPTDPHGVWLTDRLESEEQDGRPHI